jgi:hypothetical protein
MLAGIAGAAFAAWWWRRHDSMAPQLSEAGHGDLIFSNSPTASD